MKASRPHGCAGSPSVLKDINRSSLSAAIRGRSAFTKPQLAEETGLSLVTVNKIIDEKVTLGEIRCDGVHPSSGGRKAKSYRFNANYQVALILFIQENMYRIALMNLAGDILYEDLKDHRSEDWTEELFALIDSLLFEYRDKNISAIGIAVPGSVDKGLVSNIPSIPQWENIPLGEELAQRYSQEIIIENDINLTALGVCSKLAVPNMVFLHLQQGIRASLIIDGILYKGRRNFAGEIALMKLPLPGQSGSLEEWIARLIHEGLWDALAEAIALLLLNIICIVEPEWVVLESYQADENLCLSIRRKLSELIEEKYIPEISAVSSNERFYFYGAYALWIEHRDGASGFWSGLAGSAV